MKDYTTIAVIVFGISCFSTTEAFSSAVTAEQALALGKKLCVPHNPLPGTQVDWGVTPSDGYTNQTVENGPYWLVVGRYQPKVAPGVLSIMDMMLYVPKDGTPPKESCMSLSN